MASNNSDGSKGERTKNRNGPAPRGREEEMQPHTRVLGKKGPMCPATCGCSETERLAPEILLGPCCLSAPRGAVITQMVHSKNQNDFSWEHKNSQQNFGDKAEFQASQKPTLEGSSNRL